MQYAFCKTLAKWCRGHCNAAPRHQHHISDDLWGTAFTEVGEGRFRRGMRLKWDGKSSLMPSCAFVVNRGRPCEQSWSVHSISSQLLNLRRVARTMFRTCLSCWQDTKAFSWWLNPWSQDLRLASVGTVGLFYPQCEFAYWCSDCCCWHRDHQDMWWQLWSLNPNHPKPFPSDLGILPVSCRCGVIYCADARGNFCCAKRASAVCCGPGLVCNWVSSP